VLGKMIWTTVAGIFKKPSSSFIPVEASDEEITIIEHSRPFTMLSDPRLWACISSTKYIVNNDVPGAIVECGIWQGGASMSMMSTLLLLDAESREFFLFDTFKGMTGPSVVDMDPSGVTATYLMGRTVKKEGSNIWCIAELDDVKRNVATTNYPNQLVRFIQGDVTETLELEENLPNEIALLRLDTDWYESTKKELNILFPRLVKGGVCIIDDYGHWSGARRALDEYLLEHQIFPLMHVSDYTGRVFVKHW